MSTGRDASKRATSVDQTGVTGSASPTNVGATMPSYTVETSSQNPHFQGEDESKRTLTGPNMGSYSAGAGQHSKLWGHVSQSGSRVEINDQPGSESISIIHHSGAGVQIEPDGSIFFTSTSRRGGGFGAPKGDLFMSAGGEIVIDGPGSVSIKTAGDLTLDVGGILNIVAGGIKVTTKALEETVDGYVTRSVTNDQSVMIGGINRTTVAGDNKTQVSGSNYVDVGGNHTEKVHGKHDTNVEGDLTQKVNGSTTVHSKGKLDALSAADVSVGAKGKMNVSSSSDMKVTSQGKLDVASSSDLKVSSGANLNVAAGGDFKATGSNSTISSTGTTVVSGPSAKLGGNVVYLATPTVIGPPPAGDGGIVPTEKLPITAPTSVENTTDASVAEVPEANDIVDSLTSARKYPDYPDNGVHQSAYGTNVYQGQDSGGSAEAVYNEYTSGNQGNSNPSYPGGSYDTLPEEPVNRDPNIEAVDPGIGVPSRNDNSAKISKYFTLGALTRAKHSNSIPHDKWNDVVRNHILLAYNCLDQIKEKFPDIIITSAYRSYGTNHPTGRAVDIVVASRSLAAHAEIARFVRDNLPVEKVMLERNDSGRTHVHVQVSPSGQKSANPVVLTCADKRCTNAVRGINVEWLERNA